MKIELLYFEGCPRYAELLPRLRELIASEGIQDEVQLRRVETPEEAERGESWARLRFGSTGWTSIPRQRIATTSAWSAASTGRRRAWPERLPTRGPGPLSVVDRGPAGLRTFCERSERILGKDGW